MPAFTTALRSYGGRSTLHGVSQAYNSVSLCRRVLWIILTLIGAGFCIFHIQLTVRKFYESPISSQVIRGGAKTVFPDVTFCAQRPLSGSILQKYDDVVMKYTNESWFFFKNWYRNATVRSVNESREVYKYRLKEVFEQYLEIMWASDDLGDLGMDKHISFINCFYNNEPCNMSDFHLLQVSQYFNCYSYTPPDRRVTMTGRKSGLQVIVNLDSVVNPVDNVNYTRKKFKDDELSVPYSLEEYLNEGKRDLNDVATGNTLNTDSIRIYLNGESEFPTRSKIFFDFSPGQEVVYEFQQTDIFEIGHETKRPCKKSPQEISWVTSSFHVEGDTYVDVYEKFYLAEREKISELKQKFIYAQCGCYSHTMPFGGTRTELCYYVPASKRINPSKAVLDKIGCHNTAEIKVEKETASFYLKAAEYRTCKQRRYSGTTIQTKWPHADELDEFINSIVIPAYSRTDYYNKVRSDVYHFLLLNVSKKPDFQPAEELVLKTLLNQDCFPNTTLSLKDNWCTTKEKIERNFLKVWIKPFSTGSDIYEEQASYEWPEVCSEIGGTLGLWMGMSILTVIELIELLALAWLDRKNVNKEDTEENIKSSEPKSSAVQNEAVPQKLETRKKNYKLYPVGDDVEKTIPNGETNFKTEL